MEEVKYFLVLEKRLGDYNIIDINKLDICKRYVSNDISSIDSFTSMYNEHELRESIIRCNIVNKDYIYGNFKIISDVKHNLRILNN